MTLAEQRAQLKKEEIMRSAMNIIRERGVEGATMEQIAATLLMTKGSLYYYFKNKEEIYFSCHKYVLEKTLEEQHAILARENSSSELLNDMIDVHLEAVIEQRELFYLLEDPKTAFASENLQEMLQLRKTYQSVFDEVLMRGVQEGVFNVQNLFMTRMTILGALNWTQQWFKHDGEFSKEEIKKQFKELIQKLLI